MRAVCSVIAALQFGDSLVAAVFVIGVVAVVAVLVVALFLLLVCVG